jgi:Raf kinase inhibitor-like YbhB/YbcL family protein
MWIRSDAFTDGESIPEENALCVINPGTHVTLGPNLSPHLEWGDVPEGVKSFALVVIDADSPSPRDDANQEDREVPEDLPRADFSQWVLTDLDPDITSLPTGAYSEGVTPRGKPGLTGRPAEGINDYTSWFAGAPDMDGTYKGYDGPCPPWNDSLVHHYHFTVYALDVESLGLSGDFTAEDVKREAEGHTLGSATITGTYTLNPRLK